MTKTVVLRILSRTAGESAGATMEGISFSDRWSLTYEFGRGTELSLNGTPKGVVEGAGFATAVFPMGIGNHPLEQSLRSALPGVR